VSDDIILKAKKREELGKKVKALRRSGNTPAVVHDHGKDSIHVTVPELELKKAYNSAGKHHPIKLDVDGKKYTTLIKEVTKKPATSTIFHTVFQAVSANEKVSAEIPVHLSGEIPAERASLLVLKQLEHVEVEAFPGDLVDSLDVDATTLSEVGDKLTVADLSPPKNVEIKTDPEQTIATVEMPKDQVAEADAALEEQKAADEATEEGAEEGEAPVGEASDVPSEHGTDSKEQSEGEIRPGGKKEKEDKDHGHNPEKK
jgi:large subunit ribosomal protein L25